MRLTRREEELGLCTTVSSISQDWTPPSAYYIEVSHFIGGVAKNKPVHEEHANVCIAVSVEVTTTETGASATKNTRTETTTTSEPTGSGESSWEDDNNGGKKGGGAGPGVIAGAVVGSIGGLILILAVLCIGIRIGRKRPAGKAGSLRDAIKGMPRPRLSVVWTRPPKDAETTTGAAQGAAGMKTEGHHTAVEEQPSSMTRELDGTMRTPQVELADTGVPHPPRPQNEQIRHEM